MRGDERRASTLRTQAARLRLVVSRLGIPRGEKRRVCDTRAGFLASWGWRQVRVDGGLWRGPNGELLTEEEAAMLQMDRACADARDWRWGEGRRPCVHGRAPRRERLLYRLAIPLAVARRLGLAGTGTNDL